MTEKEVREQVAREIEADPFWTGARAARDYAAAIARGTGERFRPIPPARPQGHALMDGSTCECGLRLGGYVGTAQDWHAQHLAEHALPPAGDYRRSSDA